MPEHPDQSQPSKPQRSDGSGGEQMGDKALAALGLAQADRGALALCAGWLVLSGLLFVGFGLAPAQMRASWFPTVVSLLKVGAFLIAALLCWRNTQDDTILSGKRVWQAIAASMIFYALGDITTILWRSLWAITSETAGRVSLADAFYGASYLFLAIGLLSALLPRQIMLTTRQSLSIATVGIFSIVLACWMNFYMPKLSAIAHNPQASTGLVAAIAPNAPTREPNQALSTAAKGTTIGAVTGSSRPMPALMKTIDQRLRPVSDVMGLLYVAGDCAIVIMAAAMLITFWGGSYSETWKLIALAGLCLFVADMFAIYYVGQGRYQPGATWELFWILSALFFGLGAGVERGVSAAMQQRSSRRRWM